MGFIPGIYHQDVVKYSIAVVLVITAVNGRLLTVQSSFLKDHTDHHIQRCLEIILTRYFKDHMIIAADTSSDVLQHLNPHMKRLHSEIRYSFIVIQFNEQEIQRNLGVQTHFFLILIRNIKQGIGQFSRQIMVLEQSSVWNSRGQFVVVMVEPVRLQDQQELARRILEVLWKKYVYNVIVLVSTEKDGDHTSFLTWFPFSASSNCGRNLSNVLVVDKWLGNEVGYFERNSNLFPRKIPHKFNNCPLRVTTFGLEPFVIETNTSEVQSRVSLYERGVEFQLFQMLVKSSGYRVEFTENPPNAPPFGSRGGMLDNGTWIGAFGNVINNLADVTFAGHIMWPHRMDFMDATVPYLKINWLWYVPTAQEIPRWKSLLLVFSFKLRLFVLFTYVSGSIAVYLLARKCVNEDFKSIFVSALNCWSILIGVSMSRLPNCFRLRVLLVLWAYYSLVISIAFQSKFIDFLTNTRREKQVTTLEELVYSELRFGSLSSFASFFDDDEDSLSKKVLQKFEKFNSIGELEERLFSDDKFAFICNYGEEIRILRKLRLLSGGRKLYLPLRDGGISYGVIMFLRKGSPFRDRFNFVLTSLTEAGIIQKLWSERETEDNIRRQPVIAKHNATVFTMLHLQGAFTILLIGLSVSIAVFLGEIVGRSVMK